LVHTFKCVVTQTTDVTVTIDDESLNEEFMAEFRESFYPFKTLEDHAKHIAQLEARELIDCDAFVEGYGTIENSRGKIPDALISAKTDGVETEVEIEK
jgi:hypothetical protein